MSSIVMRPAPVSRGKAVSENQVSLAATSQPQVPQTDAGSASVGALAEVEEEPFGGHVTSEAEPLF